jgi:hypothetical protein
MTALWRKVLPFEGNLLARAASNRIMRLRPQRAAIFFLAALLIQSCRKPENSIGLNVQPDEDALGINQTDTLALITFTRDEDSLRSDELSTAVVGSYHDRTFGKVSATTYFHLRTAAQNLTFLPDSITIDSVILSMRYASYYGNLDPQTFHVYRVTEQMDVDSSYHTGYTPAFDNTNDLIETGYNTFTPDPFSTVVIGSDTAAPAQLRLRMEDALGDLIINAAAADLATPEAFTQFFKGLIVVPDNPSQQVEEGALLYFDLVDGYSELTIYYRESNGAQIDTTSIEFPISSESARANQSVFDYSGTSVAQQLADSTLGMNQFYVQSLSGVKGGIYIPYLENLKNLPIVINKAELILPVDYYSGSSYYPIENLLLVRLNEDGEEVTLPDLAEGLGFAGGEYDVLNKEYRFLFTRYVQQVLYGRIENTELRILATEAGVTGNRTVFNGPNTTNREKPKLVITYTTY